MDRHEAKSPVPGRKLGGGQGHILGLRMTPELDREIAVGVQDRTEYASTETLRTGATSIRGG